MANEESKARQHRQREFVLAISRAIDIAYPRTQPAWLTPSSSPGKAPSEGTERAGSGKAPSEGTERAGSGKAPSEGTERAVASESPTERWARVDAAMPCGLKFQAAEEKLLKAINSEFADVRRLAVSALGKLAVSKPYYFSILTELARILNGDPHPQVRQYAAKAIGKYAKEVAEMLASHRTENDVFGCMSALKDASRDGSAPSYVRTAAAESIAAIEEARLKREALVNHFCTRCKRRISEEEYRLSVGHWHKPYCRHCHDEKLLEDRNFEATVESAKQRRTEQGVAVQSRGEKLIAEFLERHHIEYRYDERFIIAKDARLRPDFYLPEFDLYIEYYGMNMPEYVRSKQLKNILYQRAGKKLISLSYRDRDLLSVLRSKLALHIRLDLASDESLAQESAGGTPGAWPGRA